MSKYEKYKPSGIEWIGDVPEHWRIKRLKDLVLQKITDGPHETPELVDDDDSIPFISAEAITENGIKYEARGGNISAEQDKIYSQKCKPRRDDIFIVKSGSTTGRIGYVDTDLNFNIWSPLALVRSNNQTSSRFLFHFLSSDCIQRQIQNTWSFGTQPNIGMGVIERLRLSIPPTEEQIIISTYLDSETQKIDRLIANKKAQAEKLKELRQIEINNAVTKGLNFDSCDFCDENDLKVAQNQGNQLIKKITVQTKDSGIDWLGNIPEHWEVKRLKNVAEKITDGEHIAPNFTDSGMPFLSAKDIRENEILFEEDKFVSEKDGLSFRQRCNPERGDALIVSRGATVGRVSIVKTDRVFCLLGSVILIKPTTKISSDFLFYSLTNPKIQENLYQTSQSSAQQAIYLVNISFLKLAIPPIKEQIAIAEQLVQRTAIVDKLIKNIESQIEKLQELRKIKIYEAVTGKIKVNAYEEQTI